MLCTNNSTNQHFKSGPFFPHDNCDRANVTKSLLLFEVANFYSDMCQVFRHSPLSPFLALYRLTVACQLLRRYHASLAPPFSVASSSSSSFNKPSYISQVGASSRMCPRTLIFDRRWFPSFSSVALLRLQIHSPAPKYVLLPLNRLYNLSLPYLLLLFISISAL